MAGITAANTPSTPSTPRTPSPPQSPSPSAAPSPTSQTSLPQTSESANEKTPNHGAVLAEGLVKRKAGWRRRRCGCGLRCGVGRCYRHLYDELVAVVEAENASVDSGSGSGSVAAEKRMEGFRQDDLIG